MTRLDLVLIHPNSRASYQGLGELAAIETPIWCAMLAAYVRNRGHEVAIIDAEAEALTPAQVAARVSNMNPRLAAIVAYGHQPSASTQVMPAAGATARAITGTLTMLLGGHVAALPERTFEEEGVSLVCTGEGPVTLDDALVSLKAGPHLTHDEVFRVVRGVIYRPGHLQKGAFRTSDAPLVADLDRDMPTPAYDLLPMHLYRAHNWHCLGGLERQPYASLYTSLGCPYSCSFCCIQAPFRMESNNSPATPPDGKIRADLGTVNSYRRWSPAVVAKNLKLLRDVYGVKNVKIADEMFVLNPRHVTGVCSEIFKAGLDDLNLWAYARVDTVKDDAQVEVLRAAGFRWLALGIESADAKVRDSALKGFGQERIHTTIDRLRRLGVHTIANYIFGLPGDTQASMNETLALAVELNTEFANFYSAMAYPGSALYARALETSPGDLPESWDGYSQHGKASRPLRTAELSAREILAFRDEAFRIYHSGDAYLRRIGATFGIPTVKEIKRMVATPLERTAT